jgi:hypothetical protein
MKIDDEKPRQQVRWHDVDPNVKSMVALRMTVRFNFQPAGRRLGLRHCPRDEQDKTSQTYSQTPVRARARCLHGIEIPTA